MSVTTVPGVKNVAEMEELAGCVALPQFRRRISRVYGNSMPRGLEANALPLIPAQSAG